MLPHGLRSGDAIAQSLLMSMLPDVPGEPFEPLRFRRESEQDSWWTLGVTVAGPGIIAQNEHAAIQIEHLTVHPEQMFCSVVVLLRRLIVPTEQTKARGPQLHASWGDPHGPEFVPFAISYADGDLFDNVTESLRLVHGSEDGRSARSIFHVDSLPPAGPVTFLASWRAVGIEEVHVSIDASVIADAASAAANQWPQPG